MQWIENRTELLNKTIEHVEKKDTEEKHVETETVIISEVVTGDEIVNNISDVSENSTVDINVENTSNSPNLIDEILPPKPETFLSLPKPSKSQPNENEQSLVFSEEIQNEHDTLTNELIATVQLIKRNNLHIRKMVKSDDKIITDATGLLATNSDAIQKEGKNLKSFSKTAWVSFWRMLGILFFVCFTFISVYIFIRLT
jgi:hypothetical protein